MKAQFNAGVRGADIAIKQFGNTLDFLQNEKGDMKTKPINTETIAKINTVFNVFYCTIERKYWNRMPWWEKLRAIIFFRVLAPKSRLIIEEDK